MAYDKEREKTPSRTAYVNAFQDTNTTKLDMTYWQPNIAKAEIVPMVSLTPPYENYIGAEGPFEFGSKVFNFDKKIFMALGDSIHMIMPYIKKFLDSFINGEEVENIDISIFSGNGDKGKKKLTFIVHAEEFPLGGLAMSVISPEGEVVSDLVFDFGYDDNLAPYKCLYEINGEAELYSYPTRLAEFYAFLQESSKIMLRTPYIMEAMLEYERKNGGSSSTSGTSGTARTGTSRKAPGSTNVAGPSHLRKRTFKRRSTDVAADDGTAEEANATSPSDVMDD